MGIRVDGHRPGISRLSHQASTLRSLRIPRAVAVVGAPWTPRRDGHDVPANLKEGGFQDKMVPVNPAGEEILGLPCCKDLRMYGGMVDLSVIAVPLAVVRDAVEAPTHAGAGAVTVITAGFKEASPEPN